MFEIYCYTKESKSYNYDYDDVTILIDFKVQKVHAAKPEELQLSAVVYASNNNKLGIRCNMIDLINASLRDKSLHEGSQFYFPPDRPNKFCGLLVIPDFEIPVSKELLSINHSN